MTDELLRQVRLLDPLAQTDRVADALIGADGTVRRIAPQIQEWPEHTQVRDCTGLVLGPGLVDLYSTVGEPGFEARETLHSMAEAAVAGGFTRVALLPSTHPAIDRPEQVDWMLAHCPADLPVAFHLWGALTQNLEGTTLVELAELATAGICGFSDGQPLNSAMLVRRILEYLHPVQTPIALWPCDRSLATKGVIREGVQALQTGLLENPVISETSALAALLEMVEALQTPVHIMRVSTARSVALIEAAKARGVPIAASVTWLHLLWDSEDLRSYNVNLRLDPPLGNPEDKAALIRGVETGVLDAIAVDHTPHTYEEKTVPFAEAPPGAIGLEFALPLLWQTFVESGRWSALDLWQKLSTAPLQILGIASTPLTEGQKAELTLFDPCQGWSAKSSVLKSRSFNTPYQDAALMGRAIKTWQPR
ncbi:dihydroorotase [Altericista sp. CCNU0014]|uniref:dihydroorotase n=1 Tax=Altericista sp. CCNU0014 TaxID=3082949 RepID=UPI00384DB2FE